MKYEEIKSIMAKAINDKKGGTYITFVKNKELGNGFSKQSTMNMRIGVSYANMKINEDKQTGELPWGKWVKGFENYIIEHTPKGKTELNYYLRVSSKTPDNPDGNTDTLETKYFHDGKEVTKEEVLAVVGEKKLSSDFSAVYNINFDNILSIRCKCAE